MIERDLRNMRPISLTLTRRIEAVHEDLQTTFEPDELDRGTGISFAEMLDGYLEVPSSSVVSRVDGRPNSHENGEG